MSKKILKKSFHLILSLTVILSCLSINSFAWTTSVPDENDNWYEIEYKEAEDLVISFDEATGTLNVYGHGAIPKANKWVNTKYNVDISITGPAMYPEYHDRITKLVIHEGITAIGTAAFSGLVNLKEVQLPDSLECIDDWAFAFCLSLEKVNFPANLKYINPEIAFGGTRLKSIVLPENIVYFDDDTFAFCYFAEEIIIPKNDTVEFMCVYSPYIKTVINKSDITVFSLGFEYPYPQNDTELAKKLADLYMLKIEILVDSAIKGTSFDEKTYTEKASEIMEMTFTSAEEIQSYISSFYAVEFWELFNDYHVYCYENSAQHLFCEENNIPYSFITDELPEEPSEPTEPDVPEVPDEPEDSDDSDEPVKKTFFQKIADFFRNLFDKLFSWLKK